MYQLNSTANTIREQTHAHERPNQSRSATHTQLNYTIDVDRCMLTVEIETGRSSRQTSEPAIVEAVAAAAAIVSIREYNQNMYQRCVTRRLIKLRRKILKWKRSN